VTRKSLAERLDDAANWTRIPALTRQQPRRRSMRWLPMLPLLLAFAGVAVCIAGYNGFRSGYSIVMAGFFVSIWIPMFGPLKPWGIVSESVDERERDLRRRAFLVTLCAIAMLGVLSLLMAPAVAEVLGWTMDRLARVLMAIGMALFTVFAALPTLYASWAMPPLADED
jgi:dipeptide/tripeptide permease